MQTKIVKKMTFLGKALGRPKWSMASTRFDSHTRAKSAFQMKPLRPYLLTGRETIF